MRKLALAVTAILVMPACTSTLRPVQYRSLPPTLSTDVCTDDDATDAREALRWYVCAFAMRANQNLAQSLAWQNQAEWRDLPLLGAAMTVAGLLLFGHRDAEGNLTPGEQEAVEITAFGAASFSTLTNYLSPQTARRLLRQGARGHYCMSGQGEVILSVWETVNGRDRVEKARQLQSSIDRLTTAIQAAPANTPNLTQIIATRDVGIRALGTYYLQVQQLESAATYAGEAAWNFGIRLIQSADRESVDVATLVESITSQAESVARFELAGEDAEDSGDEARAQLEGRVANDINGLAQTVAANTYQLLNGLPNVEALVHGFEKCASTALIGGDPTFTRVQWIRLN